jgi:hypothetical protein
VRALIAAVMLLVAPFAGAQQATVQQLYNYSVALGNLANIQNARINALEAKIAALEAAKVAEKVPVLESDLGLVIQRYDMLLRAIVIQVCASNKAMADNAWAAKLAGLEPIPLTGHTCPPLPARYYVPGYLSPNGPPIPPAE